MKQNIFYLEIAKKKLDGAHSFQYSCYILLSTAKRLKGGWIRWICFNTVVTVLAFQFFIWHTPMYAIHSTSYLILCKHFIAFHKTFSMAINDNIWNNGSFNCIVSYNSAEWEHIISYQTSTCPATQQNNHLNKTRWESVEIQSTICSQQPAAILAIQPLPNTHIF